MPDGVLMAGAFVAAALGMAWLALAMDVHWQQVRETNAPSKRTQFVLRAFAIGAIGLSLVLALLADTATMAVLVWMMALILSAILIAWILSWRPRLLSPLLCGCTRHSAS